MARNAFRAGQSTFTCRMCHWLTRDTGDNGDVELCPPCCTLAGEENSVSDNGKLYDPRSVAEALNDYDRRGVAFDPRAKFPTVIRAWDALQAA